MELKYRPEIDGLRTIAVVAVIIYHAEFTLGSSYLLKGGFLGVDIFFVISGFLITSLIMSEHQRTGRFSIMNFYERRARRLLPALLVVMLVSLPFAWKYLLPTQLVNFSESLVTSLLFSSNFFWHATLQEYGTESALLKPFLHTWSLAVEEQYYIIYPLILIAILRWWKNYAVIILAAGFLLSLLFAEQATAQNASFSFYLLPSRFWELLGGGLLANIQYFRPQKASNILLNRTMPIAGLLLISYSLIFIEFDATHPGFITLIPIIGTILIIRFANENDLVTAVLSSKLFVAIGLISYSLYLWHYPIFAFGRIIDLHSPTYIKFSWILLTFSLSIATYFLIEKPFRRRQVISQKIMYVSLAATIAIVITYSFYTVQNVGVKQRFPELAKIYGENEFDNKVLLRASWNILEKLSKSQGMDRSHAHEASTFEAKHRWFSNSSTTKKVLIIGDSHSKDLFNALYQNKEYFSNLELARFGIDSALPSTKYLDTLFESPNFMSSDVVIITFRYSEETVNGIPTLIDAIKNKSKKVMLVLSTTEFNDINDNPIFDGYIETHYKDFSVGKLKGLFFENQNNNKDKINDSLRIIAKDKNITLLDKTDFICDIKYQTCDGITDEGYKSFYDYGHFTLEGAKYFGRRIYETNWLKID